jgi:omega-6 fatty acid desaturase (delta-12 desaturase)
MMAEQAGPEAGAIEAGGDWRRALSRYEQPDRRKAVGQLFDTLLPYGLLWGAMVWMLRAGLPYWSILPLLVIAAGFLVRTFIIFHDCCHGSFFTSRNANRILGYCTGILTFTPYEGWQRPHNFHHATAGDLDRRGTGDIWTMTLNEYRAAPARTRLAYRIFRHPLVLFVVGPVLLFLVSYRLPRKGSGTRERRSVLVTNLSLLAIGVAAHFTIGLPTYLLIQLPLTAISGTAGVWLFYVQHQFEEVYWERHEEWDPARAALEGSSYYRLPALLEWFTGSIGFHYLHHLRPRIPNYRLRECAAELPVAPASGPLTMRGSLKCLCLHLWDEADKKLVPFPTRSSRAPDGGART